MAYRIEVKDRAKTEIEEAFTYYEDQRSGLGYEFWEALETALHEMKSHPLGYQIKYEVYRTKVIKPFPYLLIFELIEKNIIIYQCFGGKDNPSKKHKKK